MCERASMIEKSVPTIVGLLPKQSVFRPWWPDQLLKLTLFANVHRGSTKSDGICSGKFGRLTSEVGKPVAGAEHLRKALESHCNRKYKCMQFV